MYILTQEEMNAVGQAQAESLRLSADSERLNWLEKRRAELTVWLDGSGTVQYVGPDGTTMTFPAATIRDAIDLARAREGK